MPMKKFSALLLVLLMLLSLTACSTEERNDTTEQKSSTQTNTPLYPGLSADPEDLSVSPSSDSEVIEDMTQRIVQAMFRPDMNEIFEMVHPALLQYFMDQGDLLSSQVDSMLAAYNVTLQSSVDALNASYNQWEVSAAITDLVDMPTHQKRELNETYLAADLILGNCRMATVQLQLTADGTTIPLDDILLVFAKINNQWYLEIYNTSI